MKIVVPADGKPPQVPRARGLPGQLLRFIGIGTASTMAYVVIYLLLRTMLNAQAANAVTQFVTAVGNTAANRRITFGIRGRTHAARHQIQGLIAFAAGLAFTSAALAVLHAILPQPARAIEITVLLTAGLLATLVKFALFRIWVFRPRQAPPERAFGRARGRSLRCPPEHTARERHPPRRRQGAPWSRPRRTVMRDRRDDYDAKRLSRIGLAAGHA